MAAKKKKMISDKKCSIVLYMFNRPPPHIQFGFLEVGWCVLASGTLCVHSRSQVLRHQMKSHTSHLCICIGSHVDRNTDFWRSMEDTGTTCYIGM